MMAHLEILLVDDDPLVRHVIADELEEAGHFVTPAVGPEAALELLRDGESYDLVLIDYTMPGMSGGDLAKLITHTWPDIRLAILTGHADLPEDLPCAVLTKNYRMSELIKAIEAVAAGETVDLSHNAGSARVDLLVEQIATKPAVGGVRSGMTMTYDAPLGEDMPDAFASILERLPEK